MGAKEKRNSATAAGRNILPCLPCVPFIRVNQNDRDAK
jgi:hypothetical protein